MLFTVNLIVGGEVRACLSFGYIVDLRISKLWVYTVDQILTGT